MDQNTLQKANILSSKIKQFSEALECFEFVPEEGAEPISLNPRIIIEFDGDGREQIELPMSLSNAFVEFMKAQIIKGRDEAQAEFDAL